MNRVLGRMAEIRKDIVNIDTHGEYQWRTPPGTGTGAVILLVADIANAMYDEHRDFFIRREKSLANIPTLANCAADGSIKTQPLERQLDDHGRSRNRGGSLCHNSIHIQLRDFAEEARKQVFEDEIQSADQPMADAE